MKTLVATGAGSRIVSAAIVASVGKLWSNREPIHLVLSDHPEATKGLEKTKATILAMRPDAEVELRPLDLATSDVSGIYDGLEGVSWLILGAATGLVEPDNERVERVNNLSQVELAEDIIGIQGPSGCSVVFINSTYGHNRNLPLPHPGYAQVADPKHRAEERLRQIGGELAGIIHLNFVVSSIVARTGASLLLRRELGSEGYTELVKSLPGEREVQIEEVAESVVKALLCEQTGMTFFVPAEARTLASPTMLALSEG